MGAKMTSDSFWRNAGLCAAAAWTHGSAGVYNVQPDMNPFFYVN
jgi:hypothetical protein